MLQQIIFCLAVSLLPVFGQKPFEASTPQVLQLEDCLESVQEKLDDLPKIDDFNPLRVCVHFYADFKLDGARYWKKKNLSNFPLIEVYDCYRKLLTQVGLKPDDYIRLLHKGPCEKKDVNTPGSTFVDVAGTKRIPNDK